MRKTKRKWSEWVVGYGVFLILFGFLGATHSMVMAYRIQVGAIFGLVNIKQGVEWFIEFLVVVFFLQKIGLYFLVVGRRGVDKALLRERGLHE